MSEEKKVIQATERPTLALLISALVDHLSTIRNGNDRDDRLDPALARWGDGDYLYLEAKLPRNASMEADISIHQGRVFIRMENWCSPSDDASTSSCPVGTPELKGRCRAAAATPKSSTTR